jgi:hypothetical protein
MDSAAFFKDELPAGKRSKLEPFLTELQGLYARGYSLKQMSRFLSANGILVTPGAVSVFLRRRRQAQIRGAVTSTPIISIHRSTRVPVGANDEGRLPRSATAIASVDEPTATSRTAEMPKTANSRKRRD